MPLVRALLTLLSLAGASALTVTLPHHSRPVVAASRAPTCSMGLMAAVKQAVRRNGAAVEVQRMASNSAEPSGLLSVIEQADELHKRNDPAGCLELLRGAADGVKNEDEVAWRMARAFHDAAEECGDKAEREGLLREGLDIASRTMERSGSGSATKWYAILLGRLGDFLPTKEKVANAHIIKEKLLRAAVLLPQDASLQTALGLWCYKVAGISFIERNIAKLLFGEPPASSYSEALGHFERSNEIRPTKKATYHAGMCSQQLGQRDDAEKWLQACLALESSGAADAELDRQAELALA